METVSHGSDRVQCGLSTDTHEESDLPALHPAQLESDVLGLAIGQGYTAADLVVADSEDSPAAWLWVVAGAGIQLHVPVVPHLAQQLQKLLHGEDDVEDRGRKRSQEADEDFLAEAPVVLGHWELHHRKVPFHLGG